MIVLRALLCAIISSVCYASYKLGTGIYDTTGPSVQINFMGYAVPSQRGSGIHQRLRARAFYFADENKHLAFVSVDGGMGSDLVKMRVVDAVNAHYGEELFTTDNICISGTHTHSGPAGFLQYALFQITSWGFVQETFDAWVNGIANAIIMAHDNAQSGTLRVSQGKLFESNINRSPTSYLLNPEEEQAQYAEDGDTDKRMLLLQLVNDEGETFGMVNWFAVHATSMNNTNTLVSGDNKGYASYAMEKKMNGEDSLPGMGPFVAAFASSNLGDVSPNTMGPKCIDTGLPCDGSTSTCNGRCENCIAFGPGTDGDMFESTQIIGNNQYEFALDLMAGPQEEVTGPIDYRHAFKHMPSVQVPVGDDLVNLCSPSMGYSFAAGTTDGPGMMNFTQGTTSGNPFWDKIRDFLSTPTEEEIACQAPKPILFNTGDMEKPYPWDPETVPIQLFRIGNFFIVAPPAEFTTMAGRRLRNAVESTVRASGVIPEDQPIYITIAGLSNSYSSYVTTFEEYQAQRYEAASTIYGPNSCQAYVQEFSKLADDMMKGVESQTDASPPDLTDVQISLHAPGTPFDRTPIGVHFGDVVEGEDVQASYNVDTQAKVTFHSANPRNDKRVQGTYITVEKKLKGVNNWKTVAVDGDWETKFSWVSGKPDPIELGLVAQSKATISWDIPSTTAAGTYRICHHGAAKPPEKEDTIVQFTGCSSEFSVVAAK